MRPTPRPLRVLAVLGLGFFGGGCASPGFVARPLTTPAPRVEAERLEAGRPSERVILTFAWRLNERGSRVGGRGVARVDPPDRVRLDLFTENGETAARAALVGSDLRVPPDVDRRLVPPPPLLWASLGVFHPGAEARLLGGEALVDPGEDAVEPGSDPPAIDADEARRIRLRYRMQSGEEARFVFDGDLLDAAELLDGDRVVERVELDRDVGTSSSPQTGPDSGNPAETSTLTPYPTAAVYRDRSAFRELRVTLESRERADSFPPDIWLSQW